MTMDDLRKQIEEACRAINPKFNHHFEPPMSTEQIIRFESDLGLPPTPEFRESFAVHAGINGIQDLE